MFVLTLLICGADPTPPQFVVTNNCPASFVVVNKCPPVRKADLHSHTCAKGHTWWHSSSDPNASHQCPTCGLTQTTVDPGSLKNAPPQTYTLPGSGCPNGVCPVPTQTRPGLFRRW